MKFIPTLLCALLLMSCEKNELSSACETFSEATKGLEIVQEEIAAYSCLTNVYAGLYKGHAVYIASVVDPACITNGAVGVYDYSGEFLGNFKPSAVLKVGDFIISNRENSEFKNGH